MTRLLIDDVNLLRPLLGGGIPSPVMKKRRTGDSTSGRSSLLSRHSPNNGPDGQTETVLSVPHYNFNWRLTYYPEKPIHLTKGTKVTAWYDNSANNPFNPDATKEVDWGEQTWQEMMMGYFGVAVDASQEKQ
jgi:hypothetical protein